MFYRSVLLCVTLWVLAIVPGTTLAQFAFIPGPDHFVVGPGHTGAWFNPERDGEGWTLEILDETTVVVYWFTYDEAGEPRWLVGVGEIVDFEYGLQIEVPELFVTSGGEFGPGFDPDQVVSEVAGQATFRFFECDQGWVSYQAFGQALIIDLTRLGRIMGADCAAPIHGRPLLPITDDAGLTGSWFDPARDGEGFSLLWLDSDQAVIAWYTYDLEGNQKWMVGLGGRQGDQVVFEELMTARGPRFGKEFDTGDMEIQPWGSLALDLDCDGGAAAWSALDADYGEGEMDLTRLTTPERPGCPLTRPKFSDLYDFELTVIPVTVPGGPTKNRPTGLALNGMVVGYRPGGPGGNWVWRWRPGDPQVEELLGKTRTNFVLVTPDGDSIFTNRRVPPDGGSLSPTVPVIWRDETGWEPISGLTFYSSWVQGISRDGSHLVGRGRPKDGDLPMLWVWNEQDGQRLVVDEEDFVVNVSYVSDDGRVLLGYRTDFEWSSSFPRDRVTRWVDGEGEFLRDEYGATLRHVFGCTADCSIIYGGMQSVDIDSDHPHAREPWIWTESRGVEYLGTLPEAASSPNYSMVHASEDGSLLAGSFSRVNADGHRGTRAFLWSRATGMQPLADILAEFGISDDEWQGMVVAAISPEGDRVLLRGTRLGSFDSWGAILELEPKRQLHE